MQDTVSREQFIEAAAGLARLADVDANEVFHMVVAADRFEVYYFLRNARGRYIERESTLPEPGAAIARRVVTVVD